MSEVASIGARRAGPVMTGDGDGGDVGGAADPPATVELFGFPFLSATMPSVVDRLLAPQPDDELLPIVLTPNVDYIVRLAEPGLAPIRADLQRSRWVLPDGQPIVWTSRLAGSPLAGRLPGSALFPPLWKAIVADGRRAMVVAATEATAERLSAELPGLGAVVPPVFDENDHEQLADVVASCWKTIEEVDPEFVFVGISFPKQQKLAMALIDRAHDQGRRPPLFLTLGAAFEMYLGLHRRAPRWVQALGLEWFFRFLLEPKRLFRRYFVTDMKFLLLMRREVARLRRRRRTEVGS
jgi:N-acetylglucosaminyldiphosphoundecaprenol N-acetyl-beta-D-mannosaminyltransferase